MVNSLVFQFKISLRDVKPEIWRRIQVPRDYSFSDFHLAIQDAMGWGDVHLHEFVVKNPETGRKEYIGSSDPDNQRNSTANDKPNLLDLFKFESRISGQKAEISWYFSTPKEKATYMYDFGDGWQHNIVLEKILPAEAEMRYPVCLAGKRACPPEDCGGSRGYACLLEILSNPNHEEYAERMEWFGLDDGENFDPEMFDPKSVSFDSILFRGLF